MSIMEKKTKNYNLFNNNFDCNFTFRGLYKSVEPVFRTLCEEKAHEIATIVTNEESTKVMSNYKYGDMFSTEKDENRKYKND